MSDDFCRPPGSATPADADPDRGLDPAAARRAAERCLAALACTFCEVCELICPDLCITRQPDSGAILIDLDHCKGCGLCVHFCPKGALSMEPEPAD